MAHHRDPKDPWSSEMYSQKVAPYNQQLAAKVTALMDPQPTDRILDLGCGDGVITSQLSHSCASIHGIDSSPNMISAAKAHHSTPTTTYSVLDATALPYSTLLAPASFDKIFSHAALHWILRSEPHRLPLLKSLHALLRPGGALAAEFGAHGNCVDFHAALVGALIHRGVPPRAACDATPWFFPTEEEVRELFCAAGFAIESLEVELRQPELPDVAGWVRLFGARFLEMVGEELRDGVVDEVTQVVGGVGRRRDGGLKANYVRCRILARKGSSHE